MTMLPGPEVTAKRPPLFRRRLLLRAREALIIGLLFLCAAVSIMTTVGIVVVLVDEALGFFRSIPLKEFFTSLQWTPLFVEKRFGIWPLLNASFLIASLAMGVAVPVGLAAAVYLSEYASPRVRSVLKPLIEVLAGIPTVVFGYFAISFLAPEILQRFFGQETVFSALSASLAMAILLLPIVTSLSEDAMRAVPQDLREGAYALGASRWQVAVRVVMPAALSGIVAAVVLAMARAIGETMIVTIAAGNVPRLSFNPLDAMQALPAYIVQVSLGDVPAGSLEYQTIFGVGLALFVPTTLFNLAAIWLLHRFREVYE